MNGQVDADIIIHGSSRAAVQFDPRIFEKELGLKTYNLGIDAFGFHMQYCRHRLLLENNKKPSTIIQVLDYSVFDKAEQLYYPEQFYPYLENNTVWNSVASYKGINQFEKVVPFFRYVGHRRSLQHAAKIFLQPHRNKPDRFNGFQPQYLSWNDDFETAKTKLGNQYYEPVDSAIVKLFTNYIEECKRENIRLVFIYPPEYIEGQTLVQNRKEILSLFKSIAARYNIPYYDYSSHPISYDKTYFYNSQHLNVNGSILFTEIVVRELKSSIEN
jgi:hypothetical protein